MIILMQRALVFAAALLLLAGCYSTLPRPADKGIAFALMGDTPYNEAEVAQLDGLIEELNREDLAFVVHVGDITSGRGPCTDAWFEARKAQFNRIRHPFVLIPGDNDWTDCHRSGMDPMERLAKFRDLFAAGGDSLGARRMPLERQSGAHAEYREHMRWEAGKVLFVTLNVQGSNNNLGRTPAMDAEHRRRMAAVFAWMDEAEQRVTQRQLAGLVLLVQANPDFEETWHARTAPASADGFAGFRDALRALAKRLDKPILFVHGDTHRYQLDRPLRDPATGVALPNFTRVEVWGSPLVRWLRGTLHPGSTQPFSVESPPP
jgi:hypothetical protein